MPLRLCPTTLRASRRSVSASPDMEGRSCRNREQGRSSPVSGETLFGPISATAVTKVSAAPLAPCGLFSPTASRMRRSSKACRVADVA